MKNLFSSSLFKFGLNVVVLGLISLVVLFARAGDPSQIHACVKSNGRISIVGPNDTCSANETPLAWNVTGATGATGSAGPTGLRDLATPIRIAGTYSLCRETAVSTKRPASSWCRAQ